MKKPLLTLLYSIALCLPLTGCIHQDLVTERPAFAFPQNLTSLCQQQSVELMVANRGDVASISGFDADTGFRKGKNDRLLLSPQLMPGAPELHRLLDRLDLSIQPGGDLQINAHQAQRLLAQHTVVAADIRCTDRGELTLSSKPTSSYFFASVGSRRHELTLWTNHKNQLVIHSRWKESMAGLVGGSISGDGWAMFDAVDTNDLNPKLAVNNDLEIQTSPASGQCESLKGSYEAIGEGILTDGSITSQPAAEQFFTDQKGFYPDTNLLNTGSLLKVDQVPGNHLKLLLFDGESLLASRELPLDDLSCTNGRWVYKGDAASITPAWLMLGGIGGLHWETLTLWRDNEGSLMVASELRSRGAVFLIPVGQSSHNFVAYSPASQPDTVQD